jgi:CubicO group peptidase (beta-lactamase class C family)
VEQHLPEFKGQKLIASRTDILETLKKPARLITIRDLLTHTSGLPGGFPPGLSDLYFKRNLTLQEAVLVSSQQPLEFEPGSKWAYCNAGIDTLGRIIEVASGESYEAFLKKRVFEPLQMHDTTCFPSPEQLKRLAGLYDSQDGKLKFVEYSLLGPVQGAKHPIPAGGLYSTGADLAKLYQLMLHRGSLGSTKILSEQSVITMTKVQTGDLNCGFTPGMSFGYGWAVVNKPQGVHAMMSAGTYGHGGAFGTQAWVDPNQDVFVILLIQRIGLPNADGSDLRRDLQEVAVEARK